MKTAITHRTTQSELTPSETLYTDSIDYLLGGALTLRNGRIDKYQFDEGYCQAERYTSTKDDFTFCYYDTDHLGNVRQVTELDGTSKGDVIQKNNYYPFGAEFCDNWAKSYIQRHKYNGKEFDNMHGLNTYDYGARQYNPVTARWDRVDPLAHEYYGVSPYVYCMNNPVKFVDPDGRAKIIPPVEYGPTPHIQKAISFAWGHHYIKTAIFYVSHPKIAQSIGSPDTKGTISNIASEFGEEIAKDIGLKHGELGDAGNAIRHTAWQAMITKEFGENIASEVADCHEDDMNKQTKSQIFSNKVLGDTYVDLKNNEIGRTIGKENPHATNRQIKRKVMEYYHSQGLYVLKEVNNKWMPVLEKISSQQLHKAIQIINSMK